MYRLIAGGASTVVGERRMCMSCGCRDWENDHGNEKNLTVHRLREAAEAGGVTLAEAVQHRSARDGPGQRPGGHGPSVATAERGVRFRGRMAGDARR
jgi:hypothetical protein